MNPLMFGRTFGGSHLERGGANLLRPASRVQFTLHLADGAEAAAERHHAVVANAPLRKTELGE